MKKAQGFSDMSTKALTCRSLGHAWDVIMVSAHTADKRRVWEVALRCLRCKTERDDVVPAGADIKDPFTLARSYTYSDNYTVADRESWGGASLLKRNAREVLYKRLKAAR